MNSSADNARPLAVITGATSGFGLEFADIFAQKGYDLVLIARTTVNLRKTAGQLEKYNVTVHELAIDLSKPGAPKKIHDFVQRRRLTVDVLVNNAGIGVHGRFSENLADREAELLQINVVALTELCHLFLPTMVKQGQGRILNVASLAAFQAGPFFATYFASKAYVLLLSEALALEHRRDGVTISALCPPPSRTGFFKRAQMSETSPLLRASMHEARRIAESGYRGLMGGKTVIFPSLRSRVIATGYRVFPRPVISRLTKSLIEIASRG